jgi:hypothetical protein
MMKKALACTMFLGVVLSLPAAADDTSLTFNRGIGVIPTSSVTCVPSAPPCVIGPGDRMETEAISLALFALVAPVIENDGNV